MEISIVKLKAVTDSLIQWVRQDLISNITTPTESWLYTEFNDVALDDTNFYVQLKELIERDNLDQRKLEVRLMFDKDRANLPTIHIHYPQEDGRSGDNTLNTGFTITEVVDDKNINKYSRSFIGQYELIVTGGNSLEVIMLYEFLDALLIAAADTLSYNFDKFEFSGKQLMANQDVIPYLTYYRAIGISLQNKKHVRAIVNKNRAHDIQFIPDYYVDKQEPDEEVVSIQIVSSSVSIEVGDSINIHPVVINEGSSPSYEWFLDDISVNSDQILILTFNTAGTFHVKCKLISSISYLNPSPAISNTITITVI